MDGATRGIWLGITLVASAIVVAVAIGASVPYDVDLPGSVQDISGEIDIDPAHGRSVVWDAADGPREFSFEVGSTLRVRPSALATLVIPEYGAYIVVTGSAQITLAESSRRSTAIGHMTDHDRFARDYVLTFEQRLGNAGYIFADSTPASDDIEIQIELPNGERYVPESPCWFVDVRPDGSYVAEPINCPES